MPTVAEEGLMPALVSASRTASNASGGVITSQAEPSSRRSSAPASSTMLSSLSSLACSLGTAMSPLRWNIHPTAPASARLPPFLPITWRISLTTRLRLLVTTCTSIPTPPGPYPSNITSSYCSPSSCPVPRWMARSMFSLGMFSFLAAATAVRRRGFAIASPPPTRAAIVISRISLVKTRPRLASVAAFLCLMVAHLECPEPSRRRTSMSDEHEPRKPREQYRLRTRLIHGSFATGRWDYDHHVVPPQSSSTTFRLKSVHRGVQGFVEFGSPQAQRAPIYIYDRLDEPSRSMLEENLAAAEGGEMAVTFSTGMAAISAAICALVSSGHQIVAHRVL